MGLGTEISIFVKEPLPPPAELRRGLGEETLTRTYARVTNSHKEFFSTKVLQQLSILEHFLAMLGEWESVTSCLARFSTCYN